MAAARGSLDWVEDQQRLQQCQEIRRLAIFAAVCCSAAFVIAAATAGRILEHPGGGVLYWFAWAAVLGLFIGGVLASSLAWKVVRKLSERVGGNR
jgi:hypothetical protein